MKTPPYETFKKPTCRGSLVLSTNCGHCEKCIWERETIFGKPGPQDYTEDLALENGNYQQICSHCRVVFVGHKRRHLCKICTLPSDEEIDAATPSCSAEGQLRELLIEVLKETIYDLKTLGPPSITRDLRRRIVTAVYPPKEDLND